MSRTRRVYNDPRSCFFRRWTCERDDVYKPTRALHARWLKHGVVCMGKCPLCVDSERDRRLRTGKAMLVHIEIANV